MQSDTYWLNVTNIALGVVTAIAVLVILRGVVAQFFSRRAHDDSAEEETEL
jgi:flagellar biosynthesis/type III secretory pathway M-ring protein FliF/YscJ